MSKIKMSRPLGTIAFVTVLATPAMAAQKGLGINFSVDGILALIIGITVLYNIHKSIKEQKNPNTALVVLTMVFAAFQNGGFGSVEKALNVIIAASVVQIWFDSKEDKSTVGGSAIRVVFGYLLVKYIIGGMDAITAIAITLIGYSAMNVAGQIFSRKETWDALIHVGYKTDASGKIVNPKHRHFWDRLFGRYGGPSKSSGEHSSAQEVFDKLKAVYDDTKVVKA